MASKSEVLTSVKPSSLGSTGVYHLKKNRLGAATKMSNGLENEL